MRQESDKWAKEADLLEEFIQSHVDIGYLNKDTTKYAEPLSINVESAAALDIIRESIECYTRPGSSDDLIVDTAFIDGNEELTLLFMEATGVSEAALQTYSYVICWI